MIVTKNVFVGLKQIPSTITLQLAFFITSCYCMANFWNVAQDMEMNMTSEE